MEYNADDNKDIFEDKSWVMIVRAENCNRGRIFKSIFPIRQALNKIFFNLTKKKSFFP